MSGPDIQHVVDAAMAIAVAIGAVFAKKGQNAAKQTHKEVTNGMSHSLERIELKLDHVGQRLDDHIEAHKERAVEDSSPDLAGVGAPVRRTRNRRAAQ